MTGTMLGAIATIVSGTGPGLLLGVALCAATVAAALTVQPRAVYLVIPVPALSYVVAAGLAGVAHDPSTESSGTALLLSAVQWIAGGFAPMVIATAAAALITVARWLADWRSHRV